MAFILMYTKVNGRPPAHADLQRFFAGIVQIVEDRQATRLKVIGGEADYHMMTLDAYPLLLRGRKAGKYKLNLIESWFEGVGLAYAFNLNLKDPVKRAFYENVEFRRAISLAIDRERVNEAQWLGQGTPSQMTITKLASIYRPEWGEDHPYARHDPDEANRMLDAIGLDKRNADGIRLLPNGELSSWCTRSPVRLRYAPTNWSRKTSKPSESTWT